MAAEPNGGGGGIKRAIVFTTLRHSVKEIVECMARHAPAIRAR